jgi:hypothetical protein
MRGQALEQSGQPQLALDALAIAARLSSDSSKPVAFRGYTLARAGRRDEARGVLAMLKAQSRTRYVPPYAMALVHAGLNEHDAVFEWLDRAFTSATYISSFCLSIQNPYRSDPRFGALLMRCRFTAFRTPATAN